MPDPRPFASTLPDRQEVRVEVTPDGRVLVHGASALTDPERALLRRQKGDLLATLAPDVEELDGSLPGGNEPKAHRRYGTWQGSENLSESLDAEEPEPEIDRRSLRGNRPGEATDPDGRRFDLGTRKTPGHLIPLGARPVADFIAAHRTERKGSPIKNIQNRPKEKVSVAEKFERPRVTGPAQIRGGR